MTCLRFGLADQSDPPPSQISSYGASQCLARNPDLRSESSRWLVGIKSASTRSADLVKVHRCIERILFATKSQGEIQNLGRRPIRFVPFHILMEPGHSTSSSQVRSRGHRVVSHVKASVLLVDLRSLFGKLIAISEQLFRSNSFGPLAFQPGSLTATCDELLHSISSLQ
jgi:hypothetical protein